MATVVGQMSLQPIRIGKKESVIVNGVAVNSTADGVIDTTLSKYNDPGVSIVRASTGTYTLSFPVCPSEAVLMLNFAVHTGTPNVFWCRVTAWSPTTGSATLVTSVAAGGAAADNSSAGMQIHFEIVASQGK